MRRWPLARILRIIMTTVTGLEDFIAAAASRRLVLLGECSHDMAEFYAIKAEIIRRLVAEHGFSLVIIEAGMAGCAAAILGDAVHPVDRLQHLYRFYRTPEMLRLVEWSLARDGAERLPIVGMDPRVLLQGGEWLGATAAALGYGRAAELGANEDALYEAWRHKQLTGAESGDDATIDRSRALLVDALEWLAGRDDDRLEARLVERILQDRLSLIDVIDDEQAYFDWRERRMAANIEWWCTGMFPDRKAIVWGHNYHTMRRRTAVDGGVNTGESVSSELMADALSLGLYAYEGTGTWPDGKPFPIAPAPVGSLEHHGLADGDDARITLFGDGDGWWRTPCVSRSFGIEEETLVPAEQFDGVLVVRDVRPQEIVDPALLRRLPV